MLELKLAYRNLVRAKLRMWLNVAVLSLVYVLIVWHMAIFNGMNSQAVRNVVEEKVAGGQYWYRGYKPDDPLSDQAQSAPIPAELNEAVNDGRAAPVLVNEATIYPEGRVLPVKIKGIDPGQRILDLPTGELTGDDGALPVLIGRLMAESKSLQEGDTFLLRWRDSSGTFDAVQGKVVKIMNTMVPSIDQGQIWVPLDALQSMLDRTGEASYVVLGRDQTPSDQGLSDWVWKSQDDLLATVRQTVGQKRAGSIVMYAILLSLILLAIFDSQVLSIFRRRKEIGTLVAMGMTRRRVTVLFTLEGALNGLLALAVAAVYGTPLWILSAYKGLPMPGLAEQSGLPVPEVLYPEYTVSLIVGTVAAVMLAVVSVSYWPSRRIARLQPTEALRGNS